MEKNLSIDTYSITLSAPLYQEGDTNQSSSANTRCQRRIRKIAQSSFPLKISLPSFPPFRISTAGSFLYL
ncbi:MAG: hypothetical protein ACK5L7_08980 [Paludibacteraceae bacterium]